MTTARAMAWAETPYSRKLEEPQKEQLDSSCIEALRMEVLRLRIVRGAYREAIYGPEDNPQHHARS